MPLKNVDGTPLKLSGPNPLVRSQAVMGERLVIHNRLGREVVIPDEHPSELRIHRESDQVAMADVPEPADQPVGLEDSEMPEVVERPKPEFKPRPSQRGAQRNIVVMQCLPVVVQEVRDDFYGDSYGKRAWGERFDFDAVVTDRGDLTMTFRTGTELGEGGIVYPSRYKDGLPFGDHRWWKVRQVEQVGAGYNVVCMPSAVQPDFTG